MFTGLVEEVGKVVRVAGLRGNRVLDIAAGFAQEIKTGDSVAVNGCCLTVTESGRKSFQVEAVGATLKETNLDELRVGSKVNLERALVAGDRLGGHIVQGHVDEVAKVRMVKREPGFWETGFRIRSESSRLIVDRGSVCVNGVSLTVSKQKPGEFSVNVIPHTWENTNLSGLRVGDRVNVEYDLVVKVVVGNRRTNY